MLPIDVTVNSLVPDFTSENVGTAITFFVSISNAFVQSRISVNFIAIIVILPLLIYSSYYNDL